MKTFAKKIFLIAIIFSVSAIALMLISLQIPSRVNVEVIGQKSIDSTDILILGDSRAECQVDPKILHEETHVNCLNIAETAMDLFSLSLRLKALNVKNKTLVISASAWQINDGSNEFGYFRKEAFNHLSPTQKLRIYMNSPSELKRVFSENWQSLFDLNLKIGKDTFYVNNGYPSIKSKDFDTTNMFENHPWYKNIYTNGGKRDLLIQALRCLNTINCNRIILYNAPVYEGFIRESKKNSVWDMENEYCNTVKDFIHSEGQKHLEFYDLRNLEGFTKGDYYEPQHFCKNGAEKFTRKIAGIFNLKLK